MAAQANPIYAANKSDFIQTVRSQVEADAGIGLTDTGALPTAGGIILGVTEYAVKVGELVSLVKANQATIKTGAAIATFGEDLEVDAQGRFIPRTTGLVVARAQDTASAADLWITANIAIGSTPQTVS